MIKKLKKNLWWEDPGSNQYHGNMGEAESNSNSCSFIFAGHLSFLLLAWPRRDCKFSSRNMSHRRLRENRKVKGLLISSHLNLKRPRKWRLSSEFWAPSNWQLWRGHVFSWSTCWKQPPSFSSFLLCSLVGTAWMHSQTTVSVMFFSPSLLRGVHSVSFTIAFKAVHCIATSLLSGLEP